MWLRIASDTHLEFHNPDTIDDRTIFPEDTRDSRTTLILAGDIVLASKLHEYRKFFRGLSSRFRWVLYVPGNHEYYKNTIAGMSENIMAVLSEPGMEKIVFLDNVALDLGGVVVFGATLWTDMDKNNPLVFNEARECMPEFRGLTRREDGEKFTPEDSYQMHTETIERIRNFIEEPTDRVKIIVTHHAPSCLSVAPRFKGNPLNGAFCSQLDENISESGPQLWIHGHMHDPCDYVMGRTRVICNPLGYPNHGDEGKYFNGSLFVDTDIFATKK